MNIKSKTRVGTYWLTVDKQQLQQVGHSDCVHCGHNNVTVVGIRNHGELCCRVQPLLPAHLKGMSAFRGESCIYLLLSLCISSNSCRTSGSQSLCLVLLPSVVQSCNYLTCFLREGGSSELEIIAPAATHLPFLLKTGIKD